jgi:hypothetical protein
MIKDIATIATECFKHPRGGSVWSPELGRYVCPYYQKGADDPEQAHPYKQNVDSGTKPTLTSQFKLVLLAAVGGTLFFVLVCVVLTITVKNKQPDLVTTLVGHIMDLAKVGFGAIVGLLGSKSL